MVDIATVHELEEDLSNIEASIGDLISVGFFTMVGPTFEFKESLVTIEDIVEMVEAGFFKEEPAKAPPTRQMVPARKPMMQLFLEITSPMAFAILHSSSPKLWRPSTLSCITSLPMGF